MQPMSHAPRLRHERAYVLCALLGISAGFCNGLLGAAGGILLVAILPYLTLPPALSSREISPDFPVGHSMAERDLLVISLAVMLPISAVSGLFYWFGGIRPAWEDVLIITLPSLLGGILGAYLLGKLPNAFLRRLFAVLIIISGIRMLF